MYSLTLGELRKCEKYAQLVASYYKLCNNGELPKTAYDTKLAIREYNKEHKSFKSLYGRSIRGYISTIAFIIEEFANQEKENET